MLTNHTLDRLHAMKLSGMADAFRQHLEQPSTHELAFSERFALLVDAEATHRENKRLTRLLQLAHLKQPACVEDIDYKHQRALDRSQVAGLVTCDWIRAHANLHITGATGNGKTQPPNYPYREHCSCQRDCHYHRSQASSLRSEAAPYLCRKSTLPRPVLCPLAS